MIRFDGLDCRGLFREGGGFTLGLDDGEVESGRYQQTQGCECRHVWGNGRCVG